MSNTKIRNIIIIAVIAILAIAAILALPQLLNPSSEDDEAVAEQEEGDAGDSDENENGSDSADRDSGDKDDSQASRGPVDPELAAAVQVAARAANAQAPMRIDQITTMTGATARGVRIIYRYEVSRPIPQQQVDAMRDRIAELNARSVCSRQEIRQIIDRGAEIEYAYYGPGDQFLFSTPILSC